MRNKKSMTKGEAWFLLIAGLFIGTVFTFGMQYWHAPIAQEEAICTTAVYASYAEPTQRGRVKEIILRFEDYEQLSIDGVCITEALRENIHGLVPGTQLSLLVHPNSSTIMELKVGDAVWLDFRSTSEKLTNEATGFVGLGLFMYAMSACGLIDLVFKKRWQAVS